MPAKTPIVVRGSHREENAREAARMYADGQSIRAIAERFDLSYGSAHNLLRYAGVTMRRRGGDNRKSD